MDALAHGSVIAMVGPLSAAAIIDEQAQLLAAALGASLIRGAVLKALAELPTGYTAGPDEYRQRLVKQLTTQTGQRIVLTGFTGEDDEAPWLTQTLQLLGRPFAGFLWLSAYRDEVAAVVPAGAADPRNVFTSVTLPALAQCIRLGHPLAKVDANGAASDVTGRIWAVLDRPIPVAR